jgi:hypothetical protein
VPKTVEGNRELLFDRELRVIGVVEEYRVVFQCRHKPVKCKGTDSKILPEVIRPADLQSGKNMVKIRWAAGKRVTRLLVAVLVHGFDLLAYPAAQKWRTIARLSIVI